MAHKKEVKKKILETAQELFKAQGYQQTTIRQITTASNVKIGTLYHFFKDKTAIFQHIVDDALSEVLQKTNEIARLDSPVYQFAIEIYLQLNAILNNPFTAELYLVAYRSKETSAKLVADRIQRDQQLFKPYTSNFSEEDFCIRALMIKGYIQTIASEKLNNQLTLPESILIKKTIRLLLLGYAVPNREIDDALKRIDEWEKGMAPYLC